MALVTVVLTDRIPGVGAFALRISQKIRIAEQLHESRFLQRDHRSFDILGLKPFAEIGELAALVHIRKNVVQETEEGLLNRLTRLPVAGILHHPFQAFEEVPENRALALPVDVVERQEGQPADVVAIRWMPLLLVGPRKIREALRDTIEVLLGQHPVTAPVNLEARAAFDNELDVFIKVFQALVIPADLLGHTPPPETHGPQIECDDKLTGQPPSEIPEALDRNVVLKDELDEQFGVGPDFETTG